MPLDRYMSLCLGHPVHGYYMTRDPFGAAGDFTTAPEISQVFGELLGIWAAQDRYGRPILRGETSYPKPGQAAAMQQPTADRDDGRDAR